MTKKLDGNNSKTGEKERDRNPRKLNLNTTATIVTKPRSQDRTNRQTKCTTKKKETKFDPNEEEQLAYLPLPVCDEEDDFPPGWRDLLCFDGKVVHYHRIRHFLNLRNSCHGLTRQRSFADASSGRGASGRPSHYATTRLFTDPLQSRF